MSDYTNEIDNLNPLQLQQALIGAILIDADLMGRLSAILKPEYFTDLKSCEIYKAILVLYQKTGSVNLYALAEDIVLSGAKLGESWDLGKALADLTLLQADPLARPGDAPLYVARLTARYVLRQITQAGQDLTAFAARPGSSSAAEIQTKAESIFKKAMAAFTPVSGPQSISDVLRGVYDDLEAASKGQGIEGIPTGLTGLNKALNGGLMPTDLFVIAARPSMGKTALGTTIATAAAAAGYKTLFFSLEMSAKKIGRRVTSAAARINSARLAKGNLAEEEWQPLFNSIRQISGLPIWIDDKPRLTAADIRARAIAMQNQAGLDLLIVDHLGLMGNSTARFVSNHLEFTERVNALKALAKELDIPVILLAQLNRGVESRADKRPYLSDLRESGTIEETADIVAFIYREDYYTKDTEFPGIAEIIIAKSRDGDTVPISVLFQKQFATFADLEMTKVSLDY